MRNAEFGGLLSSYNPPKSMKNAEFGRLFSSYNPPKSMKKYNFGGLFYKKRVAKKVCGRQWGRNRQSRGHSSRFASMKAKSSGII
jgi:hypothetical protein